jgi:sterol desaturase/sphingolipid hydroxylase (fatty acid hydroxylase superfamily)
MTDAVNKAVSTKASVRAKKKQWHYCPEVPVLVSPLFRQPFSFWAALKWFIGGWFPISDRLIILLISILSWIYFHPTLARCREFEIDWIAQIFIRNLVLIFLVAGSLHLYFYVFKRQSDDRHYDARPLVKKSRVFTFNNQVLDNMFWTCASGVTIWSALEVVMMWGLANGYAPALLWPQQSGWLILLIFLVPVWETFYFFLIHRLLHWPPLYRHVHSLHHRNTNVGPWSGMSMHPVEHLIYLGSVMIHWIVPANPLLIIFHLQYFTLSAATTHTGYEGLVFGGKKRLALGTFHHQMHHRFFECNYGGLEIPWDKWFGSFNDGTAESHQQFLDKRRLKAGKAHG